MKLSEMNYSQQIARRPAARPLDVPVVPDVYARQALNQRGSYGLSLSEVRNPLDRETSLSGLGELVQVVT